MLITFLRIALGVEKTLPHPLADEEWEKLLDDATDQSVIGLVNSAIESLPEEMRPPFEVKIPFAVLTAAIRKRNARIDGAILKITKELKEVGLEGCILKGQGLARLYPDPALRQGGDIDVWVMGSREEVFSAIHKKWKTPDPQYNDTKIYPQTDGIDVEIHPRPTYMHHPAADRRIEKWFCAKRERFVPEHGTGVIYPDAEFNLVFCAIHILRHLFYEPAGLRQIIDYYFILLHSSPDEKRNAYGMLRRIGMKRFAGALMHVLQELFGMKDEYLLCRPSRKAGIILMNEILIAGNFGAARRSAAPSDAPRRKIPAIALPLIFLSLRFNFFAKLRSRFRYVRLFRITPSEVIRMPAFERKFRFWQENVRNREIEIQS